MVYEGFKMTHDLSFAAHIYTLVVLIPTAVTNLGLIYLLCKQRWTGRTLEGGLLFSIALLDVIYSTGMLARYATGNQFTDLTSELEDVVLRTCDWSGCLLSITMHLSTVALAALSLVRHDTIVRKTPRSSIFWATVLLFPTMIIVCISVVGAELEKYRIMPSGLSCHIWTPDHRDKFQFFGQIFFSYNIFICLIVISWSYLSIAFQHNKAIQMIDDRLAKPRTNLVLNEYELNEEYLTSGHQLDDASSTTYATDPYATNLSIQKTKGIDVQHRIKRRIYLIIVIYLLCHTPEFVLEQLEIIGKLNRSGVVDSVCTHFRTAYGLANAIVVLTLHSHTRRELKERLLKIKKWF